MIMLVARQSTGNGIFSYPNLFSFYKFPEGVLLQMNITLTLFLGCNSRKNLGIPEHTSARLKFLLYRNCPAFCKSLCFDGIQEEILQTQCICSIPMRGDKLSLMLVALTCSDRRYGILIPFSSSARSVGGAVFSSVRGFLLC